MKQLKITKLFHWLYALLMLAPCFAVLFTCLYVAFNKNAYESYSGTISQSYYQPIEYHTNEINSFDDFVVGNVYEIFINFEHESQEITYVTDVGINQQLVFINFHSYSLSFTNTISDFSSSDFFNVPFDFLNVILNINGSSYYYEISLDNTNDESVSYTYSSINTNFSIFFIYNGFGNHDDMDYSWFKSADLSVLPQHYELVEVESSTLDNVFYYSLDKVATSDIFGWARYSFIAQPFSYITGLFGMSADNPLNIYFSYWASISIIWLVFDIVLYVPLLAHKWLDEGGI